MNLHNHGVLEPLLDILSHIQGVQHDMITLSEKTTTSFMDLFEKNGWDFCDTATQAFQHQDIVSQQLSAVSKAIDGLTHHLEDFFRGLSQEAHPDQFDDVRRSLVSLLDDARAKKEAFMGHAL